MRSKRSARRKRGQRRRVLGRALVLLGTVALVGGGVWGARRLEGYVLALPAYRGAPEIVLDDAPRWVVVRLGAAMAPIQSSPWTAPSLCRRLADALEGSAWVRRVRSVRRYAGGRVVASCDYRVPALLFQVGGEFFLLSDDGVRLPGAYAYEPSLVVVQGVAAPPPEPGDAWTGDDARAAMTLYELLGGEPFYDQITGILVGNYGGRQDKRAPHILLATGPAGARIAWGSAPGQEIEENSAEEKIAILRENYRRWGRIDAGRDYIDISTFPDRFTTRAGASLDRKW